MTNLDGFKILTSTLEEFISIYERLYDDAQVYDEWSVKDILAHVTFWHEYYADNLESEEKNEKPQLFKGKYTDINKSGVDSLNQFSVKALIKRLRAAHNRILKVVENGKVKKMTYKEGSRDYTISELLDSVNHHIHHHMVDVKRSLNLKRKAYAKSKN